MTADRFADDALTDSAFLGGQVQLLQPKTGYRAGIDPVLLAASVPAKAGDHVLDLGCGGGVAMLCAAARVPGLRIAGVERQAAYADLARRNAARNQTAAEVVNADLSALPASLRQHQFDHVIANPPYFDPAARTAATDGGKELGLAEDTPLETWVQIAAKRLRPFGTATFVHRAESAPRLLAAMAAELGSVQLWPLIPRVGRDARLILVRGRKAGKAPFRLHAPLVLHDGAQHLRDGEDYSAKISAVLRNGESLNFPE
ncbi:tRNA1(Val) (adenine(37)-N6)-methyltransferase [Pseudoprimorskyibacter insulae]|uniref:tRNA1(Val) (Adenine(37)-N6)-methyltransferase n=1 Tax=Pseudoprimorskyibacter insulae TaxID=1695997 RepID=A0A2R8ANM6_9RHOB|nr:methyltransferase [Pseudoprimorskyibacter insulae]SPF77651.1 tRNA1(Val) (adenine(37)-N6)-methyltransferase [Pseudoprimorskyibacter insulae]